MPFESQMVPPLALVYGSRYSVSHLTPHIVRAFVVAAFLLVVSSGTASAQTVRVIADGASIWSNPSVPGIVLVTVKAGTLLEVVGQAGAWYCVKLPSDSTREGYILARQVEGSVGPLKPSVPPGGQAGLARRPPPPRRAFLSVGGSYQPPFSQPGNEVSFT
ncbi:MAG TPA: hypothetical protein VJM31_05380, partial [Vicinamibacterales bacterium]|nr:hypothetical protein [Vicinamibacterales bacterium]